MGEIKDDYVREIEFIALSSEEIRAMSVVDVMTCAVPICARVVWLTEVFSYPALIGYGKAYSLLIVLLSMNIINAYCLHLTKVTHNKKITSINNMPHDKTFLSVNNIFLRYH